MSVNHFKSLKVIKIFKFHYQYFSKNFGSLAISLLATPWDFFLWTSYSFLLIENCVRPIIKTKLFVSSVLQTEIISLIFNRIGNIWYIFSQNMLNFIAIRLILSHVKKNMLLMVHIFMFLTNNQTIYWINWELLYYKGELKEFIWMWSIVSNS